MTAEPDRPRSLRSLIVLLVGLAIVGVVLAGGVRAARSLGAFSWFAPSPPRITQEMVVQQVRDVAKLVSTELTIRDVVIYDQTRFGMHKRALLVVTGRVLAGIDLQKGTQVGIDHEARVITITIPPAEVLGVEVTNVHTYDERAGILFPFTPEDRDAIQRRIRAQLLAAGQQSGLLQQADRSARQLLTTLLSKDGYTVTVRESGALLNGGSRQ